MGAGHDHGGRVPANPLEAADHRKRLAIVFGLTSTVFVAQVVGTVMTGSLALLADSAHMFVDSMGLMMSLGTAFLVRRRPSSRRTWGWRRAEVLSALFQAAILLVVGVYVIIEGVRRLLAPPEVQSDLMMVFGAVGLAANLAALYVLSRDRGSNFNMRAAFLEVLNDALGSVAVIVAGLVIMATGWLQADAVASLLLGALILPRTLKLLGETVSVLLESTPAGLDLESVKAHILTQPHVLGVHDLHASRIASDLPVVSAHVVVEDECFQDGHAVAILESLRACLASHHQVSVEHSTFQLETLEFSRKERGIHA